MCTARLRSTVSWNHLGSVGLGVEGACGRGGEEGEGEGEGDERGERMGVGVVRVRRGEGESMSWMPGVDGWIAASLSSPPNSSDAASGVSGAGNSSASQADCGAKAVRSSANRIGDASRACCAAEGSA